MSRCAHCGGDDHATPACPDPRPAASVERAEVAGEAVAWQARDKVHGGAWVHVPSNRGNPDFEYRALGVITSPPRSEGVRASEVQSGDAQRLKLADVIADQTYPQMYDILLSKPEREMIIAALRSDGVAQASPDYSAWLIEMPERFGPLYFHFEHDDDWTKDHDKACHFSRKEDAEKVIEHYGWTRAVAVEHMWPGLGLDGKPQDATDPLEPIAGASSVPSADCGGGK